MRPKRISSASDPGASKIEQFAHEQRVPLAFFGNSHREDELMKQQTCCHWRWFDMPDTRFGNELAAGARLIVSRRGYEHHGIYSGDGRVIHYAGPVRYPQGRIEEISLQDFVGNRAVYVYRAPDRLRGEDILRRARSRLGECRYDLLSNNCEHFCNWCQLGESRSQQIESLMKPVRVLARAAATLASLIPASRWLRATPGLRLFNTVSPGQQWRRFLSLVSLIKSDDGLAASTASLTKRWSS